MGLVCSGFLYGEQRGGAMGRSEQRGHRGQFTMRAAASAAAVILAVAMTQNSLPARCLEAEPLMSSFVLREDGSAPASFAVAGTLQTGLHASSAITRNLAPCKQAGAAMPGPQLALALVCVLLPRLLARGTLRCRHRCEVNPRCLRSGRCKRSGAKTD